MCARRQQDVLRGQTESIAQRLVRDIEAMTPLPAAPFEACDHQSGGSKAFYLALYQR